MIPSRVVLASVLFFAIGLGLAARKREDKREASTPCQTAAGLRVLPDLPEASGLAVSRRTPGVLWSHNDQGPPVVVALDTGGAVKGRVTLTGATIEDWEDVEVGSCPAGSCLYVADIGDNTARRRRITVYRVPEPLPADKATSPAEAFHAAYPEGPQDAEALLVTPKGEVFVATKGETRPAALYRFPMPLKPGASVTLERVAGLEGEVGPKGGKGKAKNRQRITGGAVSPDGKWAALRTHQAILFYHAADLGSGSLREAFRVDVSSLKEPQGEGVALGADGAVYLCGEGGGKGGTLAHLTCALPPS
jgi:hypothetical protein